MSPFEVPAVEERVRLVQEVGQVLCKLYEGKAINMIKDAENSAVKLVNLITEKFPGFRDSSIYCGSQVFFYKRAQILVSDLWASHGRDPTFLPDIDALTMFADYRVPQILREKGVLEYSTALSDMIDREVEIESGSKRESEVRASTVVAVDDLCDLLKERGNTFKVVECDWVLWQMGEAALVSGSMRPCHRTRTIFY